MNIYVVQIITIIIQAYIANTNHIKRSLIGEFVFNCFNMLCYILNGDLGAALLYIITVFRGFTYIFKEDIINKCGKANHLVPIIFTIIQLVIGYFTVDNIAKLLCLFAPIIVIILRWYAKDMQAMRVCNIVNNLMWGIYQFLTGLWLLCLSRLVVVIINVISFARNVDKSEI